MREYALRHLARFAATEAGLVRVIERSIQRWGRRAASEGVSESEIESASKSARTMARATAADLVQAGIVDDQAFAAARARRLSRAGRSSRGVAAHLSAKGVAPAVAQTVLPERDAELSAAVVLARRRRIGPFRSATQEGAAGEGALQRELAALARAGFPRDIAERALGMPVDEAEALVLALRRG